VTIGSDQRRAGTPAGPRASQMHSRVRKIAKDILKLTIGRAASAWLPPPSKLVIFTRGRTGSNLLGSLLKSHPRIRHHGEIFGEYFMRNVLIRAEINRIGPVNYFENETRRMLGEAVVSVKFLYYQLEPYYAERWQLHNVSDILPVLRSRTELKIIHLKRRDRLATLLSRKLAERSGNYVGGSYEEGKITLSFQECIDEFSSIERWENFYDSAFVSHDLIEMYYEDLVRNPKKEMGRVFELLDLDATELGSRMHKQNTRSSADLIQNYPELKQRFAGTPYGCLFAE
jgi:LPS sulfotransferase NodH